MKNSPSPTAIFEARKQIRSRIADIGTELHPLESQIMLLSPKVRDRQARIAQTPNETQQCEMWEQERAEWSEAIETATKQIEKLEAEREKLQAELRKNLVADKEMRGAVEKHFQAVKDLRAELVTLASLAEAAKAKLPALSASFNPANPEEVSELARLATLDRALPIKIDAVERSEILQRETLLQLTHDFISSQISPLVHATEQRAREKARADLRAHFSDELALSRAVDSSASVTEAKGYILTVRTPEPGLLFAYVERVLEIADKVQAAANRIS